MCIDCGCPPPDHDHGPDHAREHHHHDAGEGTRTLRLEEDLLAKNDRLAARNRESFARHGLFVLNLVSSPGSGKTSLLERTLADLKGKLRFAVLEGDQQTTNDADRIAATGVPVKQINTGAGCHLDAHMVGHGVEPFDLGEDHKVAVLSVTEGEDKPLKYPQMFRAADAMILNKLDLLPYLRFDIEKCKAFARQINPRMRIFELSCHSGEGMEQWYAWLEEGVGRKRA